MTDKKYGICDVNHIHREIPPVIHVHNKTPFSDYDTAVTELKKKILHPGEIVVVYYHDVTADDGISTVIATGPLQQGGYNEIFKNANQIDDLVNYLKDLIKAQNENITDLAESLRQQIISEVEEIKKNTINEVEDRLNSSLGAFESNVTATLGTFEENIGKSLDSSIKDLKKMVDDSVNAVNSSLSVFSQKVETQLDSLNTSINEALDSLSADISTAVAAQELYDSSLKDYVYS